MNSWFNQINELLEKWVLAKKTITEMPNLFARDLQTSLEILPTYNIQEEVQGNLVLLSYFFVVKEGCIFVYWQYTSEHNLKIDMTFKRLHLHQMENLLCVLN